MTAKEKIISLTAAANDVTCKADADLTTAMASLIEGYGQGGIEKVTWHQCPEAVRNYLDNVSYDPSDYTVSYIADYAPSTAIVANTKPIGKAVDGVTYYNEVPNQETPFSSANTAGTVKPLDRLRWLNTPNAVNVRDLGGWACDGGTVRYGLLFRGGEVSAADRDVLVGECGVRHDLNLRGTAEATWTVSPLGSDVRFTAAADYNWYSATVNDAWKANLRCVFDAVTHNEPVYFHCAAGADRTGTLACVLEGLLGVSQSDIDKDYELTCFYSGASSDSAARRRNESEWTGLISQINAFDGNTFRDKCVTFAAMLGFTAAEINTFRAAMIDGTPETVTPSIGTFAVTNTLTNASTDNGAVSAIQYQPYTATVSPEDGYVLGGVTVRMGGVDITSAVFSGEKTNRRYKVTSTLVNCTGNNPKKSVIAGQGYGASITADSGYTLDGAAVTIKMGGMEVSEQYYAGGVIAIPNVTGDIEITITAAASAPSTVNKMVVQESNLNKRISGTSVVSRNGCFVVDPIAVNLTKSCPVTFKNFASTMGTSGDGTTSYSNSKVMLLDASKNTLAVWYIAATGYNAGWACPVSGNDCVGDLASIFDYNPTAGTKPDASSVAYVQFAPQISTSEITMDSLSGLEILMED